MFPKFGQATGKVKLYALLFAVRQMVEGTSRQAIGV
jgi:hypothetical protein